MLELLECSVMVKNLTDKYILFANVSIATLDRDGDFVGSGIMMVGDIPPGRANSASGFIIMYGNEARTISHVSKVVYE